ncbi:hypothetical protein ACFX1S_037174 [Malus domestica]
MIALFWCVVQAAVAGVGFQEKEEEAGLQMAEGGLRTGRQPCPSPSRSNWLGVEINALEEIGELEQRARTQEM